MKLIRILLIILALVVVFGVFTWYFTSHNPGAATDILVWWADHAVQQERWQRAIRLYTTARGMDPDNPDLALKLAGAYQSSGNFTKTEYTLVTAIQTMPDETELYAELCRVYVRQDKLLDAVQMLSSVASSTARDELDAMRPAAPSITPDSGYYSQYITLDITASGEIYASTTNEYPTTQQPYCAGDITLQDGTTTVTAIAVGENGLVSEAAAAVYTVGSVVREVSFTDPVLQAYVCELLQKPGQEQFTSDELWQITEMIVPDGVLTLSDLALFDSLESLTVSGLSGVDLAPISSVSSLKTLVITDCRVSNELLEVFAGMTGLTSLTLSNCSLTTLAPLKNLTALTLLDVSDNAIGSLEPLSALPSLTWLDISNNAVTDISALSEMRMLQNLDIANNPITEISQLPTSISILDISGCGISDMQQIVELTNLDTLLAGQNEIADISALETCRSLRVLDLTYNDLTQLDVTASLTKLETLRAGHNRITQLPNYPSDSVLTTLEVPYNEITDLDGLSGLQRLNYLDIDYNQVSDLQPLTGCGALVQLTAYGCPIAVSQATALTETGVIVRYSPDYTAADPGAESFTAQPAAEGDIAEIVVGTGTDSAQTDAQDAAAAPPQEDTELAA